MRAGPTISVFSFSTVNILQMSSIKVHKMGMEKLEPQISRYR